MGKSVMEVGFMTIVLPAKRSCCFAGALPQLTLEGGGGGAHKRLIVQTVK